MSRYPSESSLTVNAVSEMVRRVGSAERVVAVGPTQFAEAPRGYPVDHEDATRLAVQFKAPKYEHAERGRCYELTPAGTATLSMRDASGTAVLALPDVDGRGELPLALDRCCFVPVHAIRTDTSRLFVATGGDEDGGADTDVPVDRPDVADGVDGPRTPADLVVTAKIRDDTEGRGFDRDPSNYYTIPDDAIHTWPELAEWLVDTDGPLAVRNDGEPTPAYRDLLDRLEALSTLYPRPDRRGASPAPPQSVDRAAADRLVDHAVDAYESWYSGRETAATPAGNAAAERRALEGAIDDMRATRAPDLYRVRRTRELVASFGALADEPLVLGAPLDDRDGPRRIDPSVGADADATETAGSAGDPGQETTLSEFL